MSFVKEGQMTFDMSGAHDISGDLLQVWITSASHDR